MIIQTKFCILVTPCWRISSTKGKLSNVTETRIIKVETLTQLQGCKSSCTATQYQEAYMFAFSGEITMATNSEVLCGIGTWRPGFLQPLASKKVYIIFYGCLGIIQGMFFSYLRLLLMLIGSGKIIVNYVRNKTEYHAFH